MTVTIHLPDQATVDRVKAGTQTVVGLPGLTEGGEADDYWYGLLLPVEAQFTGPCPGVQIPGDAQPCCADGFAGWKHKVCDGSGRVPVTEPCPRHPSWRHDKALRCYDAVPLTRTVRHVVRVEDVAWSDRGVTRIAAAYLRPDHRPWIGDSAWVALLEADR